MPWDTTEFLDYPLGEYPANEPMTFTQFAEFIEHAIAHKVLDVSAPLLLPKLFHVKFPFHHDDEAILKSRRVELMRRLGALFEGMESKFPDSFERIEAAMIPPDVAMIFRISDREQRSILNGSIRKGYEGRKNLERQSGQIEILPNWPNGKERASGSQTGSQRDVPDAVIIGAPEISCGRMAGAEHVERL